MSSLQVSACRGATNARRLSLPQASNLRPVAISLAIPVPPSTSKRLRLDNGLRACRVAPVRSFGGRKGSKDDSNVSPWKSLENAMGNFGKERSIQDRLREQMEGQEFGGDGGEGGPPPDDGEGDDFGDSEEDPGFLGGIIECIQFILTFFGIIGAYYYLQWYPLINRLIKDFIRLKLFGAKQSIRLGKLFRTCDRKWKAIKRQYYIWFLKKRRRKRKLKDKLLRTKTWWYGTRLAKQRMLTAR